jgi:hypothetical protein
MRLRVSGYDTGQDYDLSSVMGDGDDVPSPDIADGLLLWNFIEAVMDRDQSAITAARDALVVARGAAMMIDAAAVIAAFNAYPRAADATGIPLEDAKAAATASLRDELGLEVLK